MFMPLRFCMTYSTQDSTLRWTSWRSRWLMMKGKGFVRYSAVSAAARQGTVTLDCPHRMERMWVVASGVRVMAVFSPAAKPRLAKQIARIHNCICP